MEITNDFIYFQATEQQAKQLDAIYVKSRKAYKLPNTLGALRELHKLGFDVMEYGIRKKAKRRDLLELKNYEDVLPKLKGLRPYHLPKLKGLRPYQNVDVHFLMELPHAAVFNEQRTGKTPTTLKLMEVEEHEKIIVICPASLVLNWKKEVEKWTSYDVYAVKGTKSKRSKIYQEWNSKSGFLVLSKDTAKSDIDLLNVFDKYALIIDEAHFLRNYKTAQSKAIYSLGKNAVKRLALTGTPSTNKGDDIYGILHFLYPNKFPSYWQFVDRYFHTWATPWGQKQVTKYKREEELREILDLISVQRKRSEVMQWVPRKQYQTIEVEMNEKQRKGYEDMLETFMVVDENNELKADAPSVLAQLTRLRQICLSPGLLEINAPSAKEEFILEWLENNPNEQVIIFSSFSSYLKRLSGQIKGSKLIIGETPLPERQKTVDSFQAGKTHIILANIQAAGVGLTLDKAGVAIFLDRAYTPTENAQAEDRIVPTTETSNQNTLIIDLVCKDSVDEKILSILDKKQSVIEVVNNYKNIKSLVE